MKTSPVYGWPIAEGTDPAKQFPAAVDEIRTLAIEDRFRIAAGLSGGTDANGDAAVTFPAGRFTTAPIVVCSVVGGTSAFVMVKAGSVTTSGFTGSVKFTQDDDTFSTTAGFVFYWIAVQAAPAVMALPSPPTEEVVTRTPRAGT